jgi:hypothetical protein
MGGTDSNIISIARGNFPTFRKEHRLIAICSKRAIVDFVTMKRHIQVGAVNLGEMWKRGSRG